MAEFEDFLKRQESGFLDSSGEFTISTHKALEKLAQFQLPNPAYWILKVLQAAVCARASQISVSLDRWLIKLSFDIDEEFSPADVQRAFGSLEPGVSASAELLGAGLRAVGVNSERKFALKLLGKGGTDTLLWDGTDLALRHEASTGPARVELEVSSMPTSQWGRVTDVLKIGKPPEEKAVLQTRAHTIGATLSMDGLKMAEPPTSQDKPFCQALTCDYLEGDGDLRLPSWFFTKRASGLVAQEKAVVPQQVPLMWTLDYHYRLHHGANRFTPEPESENVLSTLSWVRYGVIVEMERLETKSIPFQFKFYACAQGCATDISGFRLRRDEHYEKLRNQVQIERLKALRDLSGLIGGAQELPGSSLSTFQALTTSLKYVPVMESLTYDAQTTVSKKLAALPRFRKALRKRILADARRFSR